ncbi:MAG: MmgE/PrpD family protein [Chloroflexota bacterium]
MQTEHKLAAFVVNTAYARLAPEAIAAARDSLLDALDVAFAGRAEPTTKIVTGFVRRLGGKPEAGAFGTGLRVPSPNSALANGTVAHVLDYDDTLAGGHGHPGGVFVPTTMALGMARQARAELRHHDQALQRWKRRQE